MRQRDKDNVSPKGLRHLNTSSVEQLKREPDETM
jgi:hypothetical protein